MATRTDIVTETRTWLGVKWRHQGRSRENGVDCIGLPIVVGWALGLHALDILNYSRRPTGNLISGLEAVAVSRRVQDAEDGDIFVFAEQNEPCHLGIRSTLYDMPAVIHAYAGRRCVTEQTLKEAESIIGKPIRCFVMPGLDN